MEYRGSSDRAIDSRSSASRQMTKFSGKIEPTSNDFGKSGERVKITSAIGTVRTTGSRGSVRGTPVPPAYAVARRAMLRLRSGTRSFRFEPPILSQFSLTKLKRRS